MNKKQFETTENIQIALLSMTLLVAFFVIICLLLPPSQEKDRVHDVSITISRP